MSHFSATLHQNLEESIRKVLAISKTESCSIYVGYQGDQHFATFRSLDEDGPKRITDQDDGLVFLGASMFKVFTATAVALIIDKFSHTSSPTDLTDRYHLLRGGWKRTFTEVFNELSEYHLESFDGEPTIAQLLIHYKGPCNINHLFLAPDGTPLLSENDFVHNISQYTRDTQGRNAGKSTWCEYSNANYILLALLVQMASKMSFRDFLKKHIFDPLGMHRTYTTVDELGSVPQARRVLPHLVFGDGSRRPIAFETVPYLADTVEFAALGGYICAADLGFFFKVIREAKYGQPIHANFDKTVADSLFKVLGSDDGERMGYTPLGLFTGLDEDLPGSHSLNRLIPSRSDYWAYTLGRTSAGQQRKAFYMAGSATGWGCTTYFLPRPDLFITVLTNTSGPLDASDIVSRLYLQEILRLRPSKVGDANFFCQSLEWEKMIEKYRAHYVDLAQKIYDENAALYKDLEREDSIQDTASAGNHAVIGKYTSGKFGMSLEVFDHKGVLRVVLSGGSKQSGLMRFVRKGKKFRICSNGFPGLAIDCFGDWKELEFEFKEEKGCATLSRQGANMKDVFFQECL